MVGKRGLFDEKRRVPAPAQNEEGERSITVWLRSRPASGATSCVSKDSAGRARVRVPMASDASSSSPHEQQRALAFDFDRVLGQDVVQEDVFGSGVPAFLGRAFSGRDVLISTYGQTSSGKTYTMIGDSDSGEDAGILPRAVRHCFDRAGEAEPALEVHVEMVEIYNEELRDLLRSCKADHGATPPRKLAIRSDPRFGTSIDGLERAREPGPSQALSRIRAALERRATAETGMNRSSSRSHVLCFLLLTDRATGKRESPRLPPGRRPRDADLKSRLLPPFPSANKWFQRSASLTWREASGRARRVRPAGRSRRAGRSTGASAPWRES